MSFFGSACGDMGGSLTKANDLISSAQNQKISMTSELHDEREKIMKVLHKWTSASSCRSRHENKIFVILLTPVQHNHTALAVLTSTVHPDPAASAVVQQGSTNSDPKP